MHRETPNFHSMFPRDILDHWRFPRDADQLLFIVAVLVQLTDISTGHLLLERQGDGVVDSGEPDGDVGDEGHFVAELDADFFFVDVVGERVGDEVVGEDVDVVLG